MATSAAALIDRIAATRAELGSDPRRLAALRTLQNWQLQRLQRTYADIAADPRFADALEFFVRDLYGPHDFTQRDRDLKKVLQQWERLLPKRALQAVLHALELEALTLSLDAATLEALAGAGLDTPTYAEAYRRSGRCRDRERQISLILAAGRDLDALIDVPAIGIALRAARGPARLIGVGALQRFLERGYGAFKRMRGSSELLSTIGQRETAILEKLFAASPDPFRTETAPLATRSA